LQIAKDGIEVDLYEMRPKKLTEAHKTDLFAEVVCSNSFGSMELKNPRGLLKEEASSLGSILLQVALRNKVCSNSFGSMELKNPRGLLKEEASSLGSILLQVALRNKVPAGKALAIDRERFSKRKLLHLFLVAGILML